MNKQKIKKNSSSMYTKFLHSFFIFSILCIASLWILEVLFLKSFYQNTIIHSFKNCASHIIEYKDKNYFEEYLKTNVQENNYSIRILSISDNSFDVYASNHRSYDYLYLLNSNDLSFYLEESFQNNGRYIDIHDNQSKEEYLLYSEILDGQFLFLGYSPLIPIDAVTNTLKLQICIVTFILFILGILFAYFISKRISKPLNQVTQKAMELAEGDYNNQQIENGYREINELDQVLSYASKELQKADHYQKEVIANVSHDLKTPLTMISGYVELMSDMEEERTIENLNIIQKETNRLSSLVNDLLELSKFDSSHSELELSDFCITDLIQNTLNNYQKLLKDDMNLQLIAHEKINIISDENKVVEVLNNLINNAINYSENSNTILIQQELLEKGVKVSITNYGETISEEEISHIFERYYRAKEHKRNVTGSGLGLSIVKKIIQILKGDIFVKSKNNETVFSIVLYFDSFVNK